MGDPKRQEKQYENPRKKWDKERLEKERKLLDLYGLKNKRELRRAETIIRKKRQTGRKLLALPAEERKKRERELLDSLKRMGLLKGDISLDDLLVLSTEELLEKRLETVVWRKNLAKTIKQARQFIVHGHISVNGKKVSSPSYLLKDDEAGKIGYYGKPPMLEPPKKKKDEAPKAEEAKAAEEGTAETIDADAGIAEEAGERKDG